MSKNNFKSNSRFNVLKEDYTNEKKNKDKKRNEQPNKNQQPTINLNKEE